MNRLRIVNFLVKFSGLLGIVVLINVCAICLVIYPEIFSQPNPALSIFGTVEETAMLFNLGLVVTSILSLIFLLNLFTELGLGRSKYHIFLVIFFSICVSFIGLVPMNTAGLLHWYIANSAIIAFTLILLSILKGLEDIEFQDYKSFTKKNFRVVVSIYIVIEWALHLTLVAQIIGGSLALYWIARSNIYILRKKSQQDN